MAGIWEIVPVESGSPESLIRQAQRLFRAYGEFLKTAGGEALFCFSGLEDEVRHLPDAYSEAGGEVLVALRGEHAEGCIAYRAFQQRESCVEVKRLFVVEEARGAGLARQLVDAALARAKSRGYRTVCLDTEPKVMPGALHLYRAFSFVEDHERNAAAQNSRVLYLQRAL